MAIIEAEAPQPTQKKLPPEREGKTAVRLASFRLEIEGPQTKIKPTSRYKTRSKSRVTLSGDASKKRKLAFKAISESKKAKAKSL